tara:strand:- start:376 stop:729 length:354 start_codon:yes stop_codon:yes gene_type:complete
MKKTILIFLISFPFILSCQEINEKNNKVQFEVTGNCIMCKKRIENAALLSKGVKYASWDIPSNQLTLIYNPKKNSLDSIQKSISDVGHDTPLFMAPDEFYNQLPICCLYERKIEYNK